VAEKLAHEAAEVTAPQESSVPTDHARSLHHLRLFLCARSDNVSFVRLTGPSQAASTPPSKV